MRNIANNFMRTIRMCFDVMTFSPVSEFYIQLKWIPLQYPKNRQKATYMKVHIHFPYADALSSTQIILIPHIVWDDCIPLQCW